VLAASIIKVIALNKEEYSVWQQGAEENICVRERK
jgi:hypothetical protein